MGKKNSLSNVLSVLRETYKSIDMRALLAKNLLSKEDKTWHCVLTKQEIREVLREHKTRSLRNKHKNYFRVIIDCKPIDQIENVIKEIQEGRVNGSGILSEPMNQSLTGK